MATKQVPSNSVKAIELSVDNMVNWKSYQNYESPVFFKVEAFQEITSESMFRMCSLDRNGIKSARSKNTHLLKISS